MYILVRGAFQWGILKSWIVCEGSQPAPTSYHFFPAPGTKPTDMWPWIPVLPESWAHKTQSWNCGCCSFTLSSDTNNSATCTNIRAASFMWNTDKLLGLCSRESNRIRWQFGILSSYWAVTHHVFLHDLSWICSSSTWSVQATDQDFKLNGMHKSLNHPSLDTGANLKCCFNICVKIN